MTDETVSGDRLKGLTIVLTGDFDSHERDAATRLLTALGAKVTTSVSGKTSVVIAGREPGATKLAEAKKRSLPVLDEGQLLALLAGQTLAQVLAGSGAPAASGAPPAPSAASPSAPAEQPTTSTPAPAEQAPKVPWPEVAIPPRDGEYVEYFPGTDRVRVRGTFQDGLKHGSWKRWDEHGQLREDYSYERGLLHGPELDWFANGEKCCAGENRRGKPLGLWRWYHENGRPDHSYEYDDAGRKHGAHVWDLEDGQKRARGRFVEDKLHGHWTWWHDGDHERVERDYHHGDMHGLDEAWFPGGRPAYRRTWIRGRKDGIEEIYHRPSDPGGQATLAFRGEWKVGFPVGEHVAVDATGKETKTRYVAGLRESALDAAVARKALAKLRKATSSYAKADAIGEGVEYGERAPHLLHLWRSGQIDVAADPDLWGLLGQVAVFLTAGEVVKLLAGVTKEELGHGSFLPDWPDDLDRIVMDAYSRDPGPIDAAAATLPDRMRRGVSFVQARFGRPPSVSLAPAMEDLAKKHVEQYGIGQRIFWPDEDGKVTEQRLFEDHRHTQPTPLFARLIALFGTERDWVDALRARAEAQIAGGRLPFRQLRSLLAVLSPEEMSRYIDAIALDGDTQDVLRAALTEWRKDDADTLVRIALGVKDTGLRKWPTVSVALLALAAEGKPAPAELVEALPLDTESPTYTFGWVEDPIRDLTDEQKKDPALVLSRLPIVPGCAVPRMRLLREALATLPKEVIARRLDQQLRTEYRKTSTNQYLHMVDDPALWARAFDATAADGYGHADASVYGLGDLGAKGIPLLLALQKKVKGKDWKAGLAKAMLVALARAIVEQGTFDPALDVHVSFAAIPGGYDYRFYEPFLHQILHLLPAERAERILLEGLGSKHFARAFRRIGSHPTPRVVHTALTELLARESTLNGDDQKAVGLGLASLPAPRAWVRWILESGGGGGLKDALETAVGHEALGAIEKELAERGVEKAPDIDDVEKVRRRAEAEGGGSERIYLFRRLEADGHGEDLNRVGGLAPGVDAGRWPKRKKEPMVHLFTLDLDTMPELRARVSCDDGGAPRAVSVFCSSPDDNSAYKPGTKETAVVVSSAAQVAAAAEPPAEVDVREPGRFEPVAVNVPPGVWKGRSKGDLRSEIYRASGRALGEPIWLQRPEHAGSFLCQFDSGFVSMNLGDSGVMYVFADTAFWQCH